MLEDISILTGGKAIMEETGIKLEGVRTATEMHGFAHVLADSIRARIQNGQNIYDQAAIEARTPWSARLPRLQHGRGSGP